VHGTWRRRYQQKYLNYRYLGILFTPCCNIYYTSCIGHISWIKVFQGGRAIQQRQRRNTLLKRHSSKNTEWTNWWSLYDRRRRCRLCRLCIDTTPTTCTLYTKNLMILLVKNMFLFYKHKFILDDYQRHAKFAVSHTNHHNTTDSSPKRAVATWQTT